MSPASPTPETPESPPSRTTALSPSPPYQPLTGTQGITNNTLPIGSTPDPVARSTTIHPVPHLHPYRLQDGHHRHRQRHHHPPRYLRHPQRPLWHLQSPPAPPATPSTITVYGTRGALTVSSARDTNHRVTRDSTRGVAYRPAPPATSPMTPSPVASRTAPQHLQHPHHWHRQRHPHH